jgi:hypothetical protein
MAKARETGSADEETVGVCVRCAHAARQTSARGGAFWRCRRADADPAYRRYPVLPVRACPGLEERTSG